MYEENEKTACDRGGDCCGVSVMGTSAAVRDKDTNNDGSIDILDVIMLNRYLLGQFYVSNPAEMDANGNYIISPADTNCIMAHIVNENYSVQFDL